jgi:hypothetical protein
VPLPVMFNAKCVNLAPGWPLATRGRDRPKSRNRGLRRLNKPFREYTKMQKLLAALIATFFATGVAFAEDKKEEKKDAKKPAAEAKKDAKPAAKKDEKKKEEAKK